MFQNDTTATLMAKATEETLRERLKKAISSLEESRRVVRDIYDKLFTPPYLKESEEGFPTEDLDCLIRRTEYLACQIEIVLLSINSRL